MPSDHRSSRLFRALKSKDEHLAARVVDIRDDVAIWLTYVVHIFPHYPQHCVSHSDRIVMQLSALLSSKFIKTLSAAEIYCLLCAAYLHDIGMVVSPERAALILTTDSWQQFVAPGGRGYEKYQKYQSARANNIDTPDRTAFLSDSALRYLIADFARRDHAERAKPTLKLHPFLKQLVDHGDPVAFDTIADIAVGHGLDEAGLADESRFPDRRMVLHQEVNVRFLARLLRIGDLLDMDTNRGSPTACIAASPLPADATPHWRQYSSKKDELVAPDTIRYRFECDDQETHRVLRDWFGWLESEVRNTGLEQMHSGRHSTWRAPLCRVSSQSEHDPRGPVAGSPTIVIKPAKAAAYTFHDWRLQLDQELILERLIYDVYDSPEVFVRELLQNSLDAVRCQMYADYHESGHTKPAPDSPTRFDQTYRNNYEIVVSLGNEVVKSNSDTPSEERTVLTIEDKGTGMNEAIITNFFLQIGRSYYQSEDFRRQFDFIPTSRFGVGFLSVFAASNDITVETATRNAGDTSRGIRLRLHGPKSYLLTETWSPFPERPSRDRHGTRIRVVLNGELTRMPLLKLVRGWCARVEVPIVVHQHGTTTRVVYEPLRDQEVLGNSKVDPQGFFLQRVFEIDANQIQGQISVCAYVDEQGEAWCDCWPKTRGLDGERIDRLPRPSTHTSCLHGIASSPNLGHHRFASDSNPWSSLVDLRGRHAARSMSRSTIARELDWLAGGGKDLTTAHLTAETRALHEAAAAAVANHLATSRRAAGPRGPYYIGSVLKAAPVGDEWRINFPGSVVVWVEGKRADWSAATLLASGRITLAYWDIVPKGDGTRAPIEMHPSKLCRPEPIVSLADTPQFVDPPLIEMLQRWNIVSIHHEKDLWLLEFAPVDHDQDLERAYKDEQLWITELPKEVGILTPSTNSTGRDLWSIFNASHPHTQWLIKLRNAAADGLDGVTPNAARSAWKTSARWWNREELVTRWGNDSSVPSALKPPALGAAWMRRGHEIQERPTLG